MKPHEYLKDDIDELLSQAKDQILRDSRNKDEYGYIIGLINFLGSVTFISEIEDKVDFFCENYLASIFIKRNVFSSLHKTNRELRTLKKDIVIFIKELMSKGIIVEKNIETNNLYEVFNNIIDPNKLKEDKDKLLFIELKTKVVKFEPKYLAELVENIRNLFEFEFVKTFYVFYEILGNGKNELVDPKDSINFLKQKIDSGKLHDKSIIELFETLNIFKAVRDSSSHGNEGYEHIIKNGKIKFNHGSERNPRARTIPKLEFNITELTSYYRKLLYFVELSQRFFLMNYCIRHQNKKANNFFQSYENYYLENDENEVKRLVDFY